MRGDTGLEWGCSLTRSEETPDRAGPTLNLSPGGPHLAWPTWSAAVSIAISHGQGVRNAEDNRVPAPFIP